MDKPPTDDEIDAISDPAERMRQRGNRRYFEGRALRVASEVCGIEDPDTEAPPVLNPALADAMPYGIVRRLGDRTWSPWQWLADREDHAGL